MAEDALALLVQNAQNQTAEHYHLVSGAENELNLLVGDGRLMSAYLKELETQPTKGNLLKQYEFEVRDVAYEAKDIIDECLTRAALEKSKFRRYFSPKYTSLAHRVKTFRRDTIKPLFLRYGIGTITSITTNPNYHNLQVTQPGEENIIGPEGKASSPTKFLNGESKHQITLPKDESITFPESEAAGTSTKVLNEELELETHPRRGSVVGLNEETDTIIKYLREESKQLEVISIIAMPGKGKTTFARKIMKDGRVKNEFPKLIWVEVSQNYKKRKVYLSILKSLTQEDMSDLADDRLASTIKVYLQNQKFLLILDDVWINAWEDIEAALPKANKLGKVLVTSRHRLVGVTANCTREPYELDILDETRSWELLQLQVFDNLDMCPSDLIPIGKKIASGCGGVALAIVVIGGTLLKIYSASTGFNETRVGWEKVSNNVSKYYYGDEESRTRNVIALSCNELSPSLRDCFLYLGVFPEDCPILVKSLILLWITEGFIQRKPNMSLEEIAYNNLKDLKDRNLVMVDSTKHDGYIKTCRIHSLIREFCKTEASFERHNLFQEMEMSTNEEFDPPVCQIQNLRRISIHSHLEDFLQGQPKGERVHSFVCSAKNTVSSLPEDTCLIPMQFTMVRVLHMISIKLAKIPSKVSELIHLKYVALSGDGPDFGVVPKSISKLWNLETLIIQTKLPVIEFKANVLKMKHLKHVNTKAAIVLPSKSKGRGGKKLQSFTRLSTKCCTKGMLNKAKNLKNLGIRGDLADIQEVNTFRDLHLVIKLKLVHDVSSGVALGIPLSRLPNHDRFPPNLRTLHISGTFLPWNQIGMLSHLTALQVLVLKNNAYNGKYWQAVDGCFSTLEILVIEGTDLGVWKVKDNYFPKLRCLVLKDCKELEQVPFQLMEKLERLHLERASKSAVESATEFAEEKRRALGQLCAGRGGFQLILNSESGKPWGAT